jgi:hypothetical protein
VFHGAYRLFLLQIGLFCYGGEKHVSLERKSSLLEAWASSTLFPCENSISYWQEHFLQITIFKVEKGTLDSKMASSPELKKRMYLSKRNHLC